MKNYIFGVFLIFSFYSNTQIDSVKFKKLEHSISLAHYTFYPFYNGGSELSYSLRYYTKRKIEFTARTGLFLMSPVGWNIVDNRPITSRSTTYIPLYLGAGFYFGRNRQANVHLDLGIPVYWPSDYSKIINPSVGDSYWFKDLNFYEGNVTSFRRRILLIPQLQFSYFLKNGLGFQLGFSSYFTRYEFQGYGEFIDFNISGKLGLSYRF